MSLETLDLPRVIGQNYCYEVSGLWSLLSVRAYNFTLIRQWLIDTDVDAAIFEGYGLIRFKKKRDRTLFLLRWNTGE